MILSESKRFLFIHIPKTAGTSMRQVLGPYGVTNYYAYTQGIEDYIAARQQFPPHLTYAALAKVLTVDVNHYYKFAFVRNPWDRLVSLYEYYRVDTEHAMYERCKSCSFAEFVDDVLARNAPQGTRNQVDFLYPPPGMAPVDFIGKVENIEADFAAVCRRLEIGNIKLPVLNATRHRNYRDYYTPALRKKVDPFYEADWKSFRYSF